MTKPLSGMVKIVTEAQDFVPSLGRRRVSPQILSVETSCLAGIISVSWIKCRVAIISVST